MVKEEWKGPMGGCTPGLGLVLLPPPPTPPLALSSCFCLILLRPSVYFAAERKSGNGSPDSKGSKLPPPPASLWLPLQLWAHPRPSPRLPSVPCHLDMQSLETPGLVISLLILVLDNQLLASIEVPFLALHRPSHHRFLTNLLFSWEPFLTSRFLLEPKEALTHTFWSLQLPS